MELAAPSLQTLQSLTSVERVAQKAFNCGVAEDVLGCVCYVTKQEDKSAERVWRQNQEFHENDKEEEEEEEEKERVDALVVQVPQLPRDAVVEWQVILFSLEGYRSFKNMDPDIDPSSTVQAPKRIVSHKKLNDDGSLLQGQLQLVAQGASFCVSGYAFNYAQAGVTMAIDDCSVFPKIAFLAQQSSSFVRQQGGCIAVSVRIFYPDTAAAPSFEEQESLQSILGSDVAITYVPVEMVARRKKTVGIFVYGTM